jgi:monoamine oxidase
MEPDDVKAEALAVLHSSFPAETIDASRVQILQSRWSTDRLSRGSYSNIPPGGAPDDRDALAEPVMGRLLFAGEATHRTCSQTVHGAVLSGWREARRILSSL